MQGWPRPGLGPGPALAWLGPSLGRVLGRALAPSLVRAWARPWAGQLGAPCYPPDFYWPDVVHINRTLPRMKSLQRSPCEVKDCLDEKTNPPPYGLGVPWDEVDEFWKLIGNLAPCPKLWDRISEKVYLRRTS